MKKQTFIKVGDTFHRLTATKFMFIGKHNRRHFRFRCECGKHITVSAEAVISGNTKSCGCLRRDAIIHRYNLAPGRAAMRQLILQSYKRHSKQERRKWCITEDQFYDLSQKPCHYCGALPSRVKKSPNNTGDFVYNGLDRIDSSRQYTLENLVACCRKCNVAKSAMSVAEFYRWVKQIAAMAEQWGSLY